MEHEKWRKMLSPYIDGELPEAGRSGFEAHLADCASCEVFIEDWRRAKTSFFSEPEPAPDETFVAAVMRRLPEGADEEELALPFRWWAPAYGLALAALAVLFLGPSSENEASVEQLLWAQLSGGVETLIAEDLGSYTELLGVSLEDL